MPIRFTLSNLLWHVKNYFAFVTPPSPHHNAANTGRGGVEEDGGGEQQEDADGAQGPAPPDD